ncbi:MAG: SusC/RagA family TonB-linked outer membrane protein [Chitinophagaceae bacterium]|nr:SusC/RagA family TonB-linked outer membrane protein [Chitinophagaceae bacterium]
MFTVLLFSFTVFGQRTLTGKISGPDNQPVFGATVSIKGTNVATTTATDGTFTLTVPGNRSYLLVTYVGYETTEVNIAGKNNIDVGLKLQTSNLNEVVVTGYTAQRKKEITGSVSVVNVKDMKSIPAGSPEQMLQGQASGVTIIGSGNPGDNSNIFIRGVTSFGGTNPLIVVDGVPSAPNDLSLLHDLSANDIESVQVIKDGQAAIYGARGSAGVILITTKKGRGRATITYDAYYGTQRVPQGNVWHKLDTKGMADLYFLAAKNTGQVLADTTNCPGCVVSAQYGTGLDPVIPEYITAGNKSGVAAGDPAADPSLYNIDYNKGGIYQIVRANRSGTDWFHEVFKPAPIMSHTLSASGGSDKSNYLFSVNYFDQKGTLMNTHLKRYAARMNTSFSVKNNIRIGENAYVFYKENPRITNNVEGNEVNGTAWMQPIIPIYDINGGFAGTRGNELGNSGSPVASRVRAKDNKGYDWAVQGNVWAEADILKHFLLRTSFGGNVDNYAGFSHGYHTYENKENNGSNSYSEYAGHVSNWTWTNTLAFNTIFADKHAVKVLVGIESAQFTNREVGGNRLGYFSDDPNFLNLSTGAPGGQTNYSFSGKSTLYSQLARIDYAYSDKIFLGLNGRRDQSSVLGPDSRTGYFGSISAGWQISQENFMKSISWLNSLKLRASYGILGSISNTTGVNSFTLYGQGAGTTFYAIDGSSTNITQGFAYTNFGNPNTKWEGDAIINVGIDATIIKNKLDFSVEWYQKKINGLLFQDQAPAVVGGATQPNVNIGDLKNTGVDFSATYHTKISKDFNLNIGANITTYKNLVVRIPGTAGFFTAAGTHNTGPQVRNQAGHPVGSFFGYHIIGTYRDADDVAKSATETDAAPGRFKYEDVNKDGVIDDDDRTFFGDPNPKFTYGISLSASYKQFDFSMVLYGSQGNDILNYTRYTQDFYPQFQNSKSQGLLTDSWLPVDRSLPRAQWTSSNPNAAFPIVENNSYFSTNGVINDFYMENGSFLRCKQMQIGYNLASATLKHVGIDKARIYIQSANLFTVTKYSGLDPEIATAGNTTTSASSFGVDYSNYPPMKTFLVGINVTF